MTVAKEPFCASCKSANQLLHSKIAMLEAEIAVLKTLTLSSPAGGSHISDVQWPGRAAFLAVCALHALFTDLRFEASRGTYLDDRWVLGAGPNVPKYSNVEILNLCMSKLSNAIRGS